jgi:hypothetical protein
VVLVVVVVLLEVLVVGSVLAGAVDDGSVLAGTVVATLLDGVVDEATDEEDELLPITIAPSSSSFAHQISPAISRNKRATPTMITAARGPGSSYQRFVGGTGGGTTGPPPVAVGGITGTSPVIGPVGGNDGVVGITWVGSEGGGIGPSDIGTINGSSGSGSSEDGSRGAPGSLTRRTVPLRPQLLTAHHGVSYPCERSRAIARVSAHVTRVSSTLGYSP